MKRMLFIVTFTGLLPFTTHTSEPEKEKRIIDHEQEDLERILELSKKDFEHKQINQGKLSATENNNEEGKEPDILNYDEEPTEVENPESSWTPEDDQELVQAISIKKTSDLQKDLEVAKKLNRLTESQIEEENIDEVIKLSLSEKEAKEKNNLNKAIKLSVLKKGVPTPGYAGFFELLDAYIIQKHILPKLENKDFVAFSQTCRFINSNALDNDALTERRGYHQKMLAQRKLFKKSFWYNGKMSIRVDELYSGVFDDPFFAKIQELQIDGTNKGITQLPHGIFKGLTNLRKLSLVRSQLTHLDKDVFKELDNLKVLFLHDNRLTHLDKDVFKGLKNLEELYLSDNQLTHLDKDVFKELDNLKVLFLHDNLLVHLDKDTFKGLDNLEDLDLNRNKLRHLDKDIFKGMKNLQRLTLHYNKLTYLDKDIFTESHNLEYLYLFYNQLTHLDKGIFAKMKCLKRFWVDDNRLTPQNIQELKNALSVFPNCDIRFEYVEK